MATSEKKEQAAQTAGEQGSERLRGGGDVSCKDPEFLQGLDTEQAENERVRQAQPETES